MSTLYKNKIFLFFASLLASHSIAMPSDVISKLGFDLRVSSIPKATETSKTPVITVLGFPDPENMYRGKFDADTTFTVTFRFHNTCLRSYLDEKHCNPIDYIKAIRSINIGQEPDASVLLWVVAECYRQGHSKVHIFGNSRGGGTVIKLLDILSNPKQHVAAWQMVGITDPNEQLAVQTMVASGQIYLAHPLMDYDNSMRLTAERIVHPLVKLTRWSLAPAGQAGALLASTCNNTAYAGLRTMVYYSLLLTLQTVSSYSTTSANPIAILEQQIETAHWPYHITIALADQDIFAGKKHEEKLYELAKKLPEKLSIVAGGPDHFTIRSCIKQFHKTIRKLAPTQNTPSF